MKTILSGIHLSVEYIVHFASLSLQKSGLSQAKTKQSHEGIGWVEGNVLGMVAECISSTLPI